MGIRGRFRRLPIGDLHRIFVVDRIRADLLRRYQSDLGQEDQGRQHAAGSTFGHPGCLSADPFLIDKFYNMQEHQILHLMPF